MGDYILGYDPGRPIEPIKPPELLSPVRKPSYLDELKQRVRLNAIQEATMRARAEEMQRRLGEVVREEIRQCQSGGVVMNIYERVKAVMLKAKEEGHTCEVLLTPLGLRDLLYFGVLSAEAKLAPPNTFFGMPCRLVHEVPVYNPGLEPIGNGIFIQRKEKPVFPPYQVSPEELREMDKVNVHLAITLRCPILLCCASQSPVGSLRTR